MAEDNPVTRALRARRSVRSFGAAAAEQASVRRLVQVALGAVTADGKRCAPSAHGLYPLRRYLTAGRVSGLAPGLYQCGAGDGGLALCRSGDLREQLQAAALEEQPWIGAAAFVLSICGDAAAATARFAGQMPYGQRGLRYMQLEAGAVAQNLMLQGAQEGLGSVLVAGFRDEETAAALQLPPPVAPIAHICFGTAAEG
jgi:SagB-type dehydrogenase family enzyme